MGFYTLFHPEVFQGRGKRSSYFEGWYIKMSTCPAGNRHKGEVIALIPGVSLDSAGNRHSFIQVISSGEGRSWYIPFGFDEFTADRKKFSISVGSSSFSEAGVTVDIAHEDLRLTAEVTFTGLSPFPVTVRAPGIMGWYAYVPFMECFHGVVSTAHLLTGSLSINGRKMNVDGGTGYIEKDWGRSFPEAWVWMQANCFPESGTSCMLSAARIPFLGRVFTGFLGFVKNGDNLIRFGTYTGAAIESLESSGEQARVVIRQKERSIEFIGELGPASHLAAPRQGRMERTILESIEGVITLVVRNRHGAEELRTASSLAGIELSEAQQLRP
jgi:tocopherol cyclase